MALLLRVLDHLPDQKDPYVLATDQGMLDRLREQMSVNLGLVKAELKRSIISIYGVFRQHSICNQIKDVERILAANSSKINHHKRVLRQLKSDYKARQSWPSRLLNRVGIDNHVLPDLWPVSGSDCCHVRPPEWIVGGVTSYRWFSRMPAVDQ